uniref:Condensin complex subunit 1 C-terminal domain-containing protein n=1 Tax=Globisporangium ultimum (strain ATCC 200006 / CBS 805.95 / DAOM BR144) TaxID=431595 RepID=K3W9Y1_GLOUD
MSDEQKLQISMKLCNEILEEVTDGKLVLCKNPSEITDHGTEAVLKDTFAILCSSDIKLSASKDAEDDVDGEEGGADANIDISGNSGSVSTQLAAAKGKLLSKMSKKNFLENVVPILIGLKHKLESKRSPLMRYLQHYFHELFKLYRQEVKDILSADPQMAMEVEYDIRQFELHHKKHLEQQQRQLNAATAVPAATTATPVTPPKTPSPTRLPTTTPFNMLEVSETPMIEPDSTPRLREGADGKKAKKTKGARRRRRMAVESPLRVIEKRASLSQVLEDAEAANVMLFSPNKDLPARSGDSWQVVVKSPTVTKSKKTKGKKKGSTFTQEDLEQSMQKELDYADGGIDSSEDSPAEKEPKSRKSKANVKPKQSAPEHEEEEEEFVQLPLKKKSKKKGTEKTTSPKKKSRAKAKDDSAKTTAKRKRN